MQRHLSKKVLAEYADVRFERTCVGIVIQYLLIVQAPRSSRDAMIQIHENYSWFTVLILENGARQWIYTG
jgi:hypothetical protein